MTDLITRARDQWCCLEYVRETVHGEQVTGYYSCPPEVVAALLDVMGEVMLADSCPSCFGHRVYKHRPGCIVTTAEAAIAKALEGV